MSSFRKSPVALAILFVLAASFAAPLAPAGAAPQGKDRGGPRKFYLTKTTHNGSQALSACAAGYHMASIWEILDPSNLRYDAELGRTADDSGSGPPTSEAGWIRTGYPSGLGFLGASNCNAWTDSSALNSGNTVGLSGNLFTTQPTITPWFATALTCNTGHSVWCVQD